MFNFFKREPKKTQETVTTEQLEQYCAARGWQFFADRESLASFRDAEYWVPATVPIVLPPADVVEGEGADFIVGNEMAVRFCICSLERPDGSSVMTYVARNWKKCPDMLLVHGNKGNARLNSTRIRAYGLTTDNEGASNAQVTRPLENVLLLKSWCVLARGDWFTCHYNARPSMDGIDKIIELGTQLISALPTHK